MELRGALPEALRMWWIFSSPFAVPFAIRIGWEKTVWSWTRGPQLVGFSLLHIHPGLAVIGIIGSLSMIAWLLAAIPYMVVRREIINLIDLAMTIIALLVAFAVMIPDRFFA